MVVVASLTMILVALQGHCVIQTQIMFSFPVLWIRIRIGSVFRSFVDPDSQYGSGSTHVNTGTG